MVGWVSLELVTFLAAFVAAAFLTAFDLIWLDHGGTDSDDDEETQFR